LKKRLLRGPLKWVFNVALKLPPMLLTNAPALPTMKDRENRNILRLTLHVLKTEASKISF